MSIQANEISVSLRGGEARRYRALEIGDRWQKSAFEYFTEAYGWRTVRNWTSRERLFDLFTALDRLGA